MISLRDRKKTLADKIKTYNSKISDINGQLGLKEDLFFPQIDKELEEPESYYEITEDQIDHYAQENGQKTEEKDAPKPDANKKDKKT